MVVDIVDIYQPLILDITINNTKGLSYFALGTEIVFSIIAKARYSIPRVTLASDSVYVSIEDSNGIVRKYRQLAEKTDKIFTYRFQDTNVLGAWKCSMYGILNDNHFITRPFTGFVLQ